MILIIKIITCCNLNDVNDSVAICGVNDSERLLMYPSQV